MWAGWDELWAVSLCERVQPSVSTPPPVSSWAQCTKSGLWQYPACSLCPLESCPSKIVGCRHWRLVEYFLYLLITKLPPHNQCMSVLEAGIRHGLEAGAFCYWGIAGIWKEFQRLGTRDSQRNDRFGERLGCHSDGCQGRDSVAPWE